MGKQQFAECAPPRQMCLRPNAGPELWSFPESSLQLPRLSQKQVHGEAGVWIRVSGGVGGGLAHHVAQPRWLVLHTANMSTAVRGDGGAADIWRSGELFLRCALTASAL